MDAVQGFICSRCAEVHPGPSVCLASGMPTHYVMVPPDERDRRCWLTDDLCVIDDEHFYIYGSVEVPIRGCPDGLSWGVWASLSERDFDRCEKLMGVEGREVEPPYAGRLSTDIPLYPPCLELVCEVRTQPAGYRPLVVLRPADHPLYQEQRDGITVGRAQEIMEWFLHGRFDGA